MEPFNLPVLDGLHFVDGLCDGVFLGAAALAGFPSLKTLQHTAQLGVHGVNVFNSDSRNPSMVVSIHSAYEGMTTEQIAQEMVGQKTFIGWPFLQEGLVVAVSDELFRHELKTVAHGKRVIGSPHSPEQITMWRRKAERIEFTYSKRFAVLTGQIDVLLHVRPLKGRLISRLPPYSYLTASCRSQTARHRRPC